MITTGRSFQISNIQVSRVRKVRPGPTRLVALPAQIDPTTGALIGYSAIARKR